MSLTDQHVRFDRLLVGGAIEGMLTESGSCCSLANLVFPSIPIYCFSSPVLQPQPKSKSYLTVVRLS